MLARLGPHVRNTLLESDSPFMWEMRNRTAQGYLLVDSDIVRPTGRVDLPDIVQIVRQELTRV